MVKTDDNKGKVHWTVKVTVFIASVISLSGFFAGWREIHQAQVASGCVLLVCSVACTACLLGIQGYWIYFEEKAKGTLRKRISFYEKIHDLVEQEAQERDDNA